MKRKYILTVEYKNQPLKIDVIGYGSYKMYRAKFKDLPPLMLTKAKAQSGEKFWTSIPQGRLELAKEIGALIDKKDTAEQQSLF